MSLNTTFKLNDVKVVLEEALEPCMRHLLKEEQNMWGLDVHIITTTKYIIITPGVHSESDSDSDSASDGI